MCSAEFAISLFLPIRLSLEEIQNGLCYGMFIVCIKFSLTLTVNLLLYCITTAGCRLIVHDMVSVITLMYIRIYQC